MQSALGIVKLFQCIVLTCPVLTCSHSKPVTRPAHYVKGGLHHTYLDFNINKHQEINSMPNESKGN